MNQSMNYKSFQRKVVQEHDYVQPKKHECTHIINKYITFSATTKEEIYAIIDIIYAQIYTNLFFYNRKPRFPLDWTSELGKGGNIGIDLDFNKGYWSNRDKLYCMNLILQILEEILTFLPGVLICIICVVFLIFSTSEYRYEFRRYTQKSRC